MSQTPLETDTPNVDIRSDVQGDVILGFPKKKEEFVFFVIEKPADFKEALPRLEIASTADVMAARQKIATTKAANPGTLAVVGLLNIAFSRTGLDALGVKEDIGDAPFTAGQLADAKNLGDKGVTSQQGFIPNWETAFKQPIHGVLVIAGETWRTVNERLAHATNVLGESIRVVHNLKGTVRPEELGLKGREHFGWEDGISNPAVRDVGVDGEGTILPGQHIIRPGIMVCGMEGDSNSRPPWAVGGSFLVFRQLEQLVPEFDEFLTLSALPLNTDPKEGAELLGARLVGRWKSGAPIQLTPNLKDDPELGKDKQHNNLFPFPQDAGDAGQELCPFAAHIRKTNPRNDLPPAAVERASLIRAGIPYGPELSDDERRQKVTEFNRGLAFVCYQSSVARGFQFMQKAWANAPTFPPKRTEGGKPIVSGFDPLIGQANGRDRDTWGTVDGFNIKGMPEFINSRGGEYFFSPSIPVLKSGFSK